MRRTVQPASASGSAFQSTHLSGVRPELRISSKNASLFQSTHPSGVRRPPSRVRSGGRCISIHAPQWGATGCRSIGMVRFGYFNPRTPVGCDMDEVGWQMQSGISIHAPQWGATAPRTMQSRPTRYFNPRTPVGCDGMAWELCPAVLRFQSTHPSGVRRFIGCTTIMSRCNFNPRTPVGCDVSADTGTPVSMNFNPRTPVGCDIVGDDVVPDALISIHAPQWGATAISATGKDARGDFNPRTPVGCDNPTGLHQPLRSDFNPRTPVGCDDRRQGEHHRPGISIHAPQWGATSAYHQSPAGALFQSTHPSGVRPTDSAAIVRCKQFQSTHPSGVRLVPAPP